MRALVIGYGSIGARHARLLTQRGVAVACAISNADCSYPRHRDVATALASHAPDLVVVANATSRHVATLGELTSAGYAGRLLVEKPFAGTAAALPVGLPGAHLLVVQPALSPAGRHLARRPDRAPADHGELLRGHVPAGLAPDRRPPAGVLGEARGRRRRAARSHAQA